MKLSQWFFAFMIGILLIIGLMLFSSPPPNATGTIHPEFSSMLKSGTSVAQLPQIKWLAYIWGICVLGLYAFPLYMATRKKDPELTKNIYKKLSIGFVLYALIFTLLAAVYWHFYGVPQIPIWAGFPAPTAIMLYIMTIFPIFFTVIYITKFEEWIIRPEEIEAFHKIVENRNQKAN